MKNLSKFLFPISLYFVIPAILLYLNSITHSFTYFLSKGNGNEFLTSLDNVNYFLPFIIVPYLSLLVGMLPTLLTNSFLKLKSIRMFVLFSMFFGLTIYNLTVNSWGQMGGRIDSITLSVILVIYLVCSFVVFLKHFPGIEVLKQKLSSFSLNRIDLIFYTAFFLLFIYCLLLIFNYYYPEWDNFSFWVTDAKIIFVTKYLRNSFEIIGNVNYTSYYPLHAVYIFELFGTLKEQYAAFFTILYAAIAGFLAYSLADKTNNTIKVFTGLTVILILNAFIYNEKSMFTSYAETIVSCNVFVATLLILKKASIKTYWIKSLLVLLILFVIWQIKFLNIYYSAALLAIWIWYDFQLHKTFFSEFLKNRYYKNFLITLSILGVLIITREYYFRFVWPLSEQSIQNNVLKPFIQPNISSFEFYIDYVSTILSILVTKYSWLFIIYILFIHNTLLFNKLNRKRIVILAVLLILPAINIFEYLINVKALINMSLVRYTTPMLFSIPILIIINKNIYSKYVNNLILFLISIFIVITNFIYITSRNPVDFTFHTGSYQDASSLSPFYLISEAIKELKLDNPVLVANNYNYEIISGSDKAISNLDLEGRTLKYFLFEENHDGSFYVEIEEFDKYLSDNNIKYFLVSNFSENTEEYLKRFKLEEDNSEEYQAILYEVVRNENTEKIEYQQINIFYVERVNTEIVEE